MYNLPGLVGFFSRLFSVFFLFFFRLHSDIRQIGRLGSWFSFEFCTFLNHVHIALMIPLNELILEDLYKPLVVPIFCPQRTRPVNLRLTCAQP